MKKIILLILLLLFLIRSFGQQQTNPTPEKTKADYLKISKNQKTAAWILFGGGSIMLITGSAIFFSGLEEDFFDPKGEGLMLAGFLVALPSIPLFIASGKNERRAASLSFSNMKTPQIKNSSMVYRPIPALSLKLTL